MRIFNKKKNQLTFEGPQVTATRAMRADNRHFPVIEVRLKSKQAKESGRGEQVEEVIFYLDLEDAMKLYGQMGNSISAATPRIPRPAGHYQYGEGTGQN